MKPSFLVTAGLTLGILGSAVAATLCPENSASVMVSPALGSVMTLNNASADWQPPENPQSPPALKVTFYPAFTGATFQSSQLTPLGQTTTLMANQGGSTNPPWSHFTFGGNGNSFPIKYSGHIEEGIPLDDRSLLVRYKFRINDLHPGSMYQIDLDSRFENKRCYSIKNILPNYPPIMQSLGGTEQVWCGHVQVYVQDDSRGDENTAPKMPLFQPKFLLNDFIESAFPTGHENFRESSTFRPGSTTATLVIELQGFIGDYIVDHIGVTELTGTAGDEAAEPFLKWPELPDYAGVTAPAALGNGMALTTSEVGAAHKVHTYAGVYSLVKNNNSLIISARTTANDLLGTLVIADIGGELVSRESKANYLERFNYPNALIAVGADASISIHIRDQNTVLTVNGIHGGASAYSVFEHGVIFQALLYGEHGFFFAPVRSSMELHAKTANPAPQHVIWSNQTDLGIGLDGAWAPNVPNFENAGGWTMTYQAPKRSWFMMAAFPPKPRAASPFNSSGRLRYYSANFDPVHTATADPGPMAVSLQQFMRAPQSIRLSFLNVLKYTSTLNPLNPPASELNGNFEFSGPIGTSPEHEPKVREYIRQAHLQNPSVPVVLYISPEYYIQGSDALLFKNIVELQKLGADGMYLDGYFQRPLETLRLLRLLRTYFDSVSPRKVMILHSSHDGAFYRRSELYRVPFFDALADILWKGEANWSEWDVPKFDNSTPKANISADKRKVMYPPPHSDISHFSGNPLPYVKSCPPLWGLMYAGKGGSNTPSSLSPELRPRNNAALTAYTASLTGNNIDKSTQLSKKLADPTIDGGNIGTPVPLSPSQQIAAQTQCGGMMYAQPFDYNVAGYTPSYKFAIINFTGGGNGVYFSKMQYANCLNSHQGDAQVDPLLGPLDSKLSLWAKPTSPDIPITNLTNPSDWWKCWLPTQ